MTPALKKFTNSEEAPKIDHGRKESGLSQEKDPPSNSGSN